MENKIWNVLFTISHTVYLDGSQNIVFTVVYVSKYELLKETPKKFKVKRTEYTTHWKNVTVKESLYKKEDVHISNIESISDLNEKIAKYRKQIEDSDRLSEYKRKSILEQFDILDNQNLDIIFT